MKTETKNKKYLLEIEVNEEILRNEREGLGNLDTKKAIKEEFGWLHQSGIYLAKINAIKKKRKSKSH